MQIAPLLHHLSELASCRVAGNFLLTSSPHEWWLFLCRRVPLHALELGLFFKHVDLIPLLFSPSHVQLPLHRKVRVAHRHSSLHGEQQRVSLFWEHFLNVSRGDVNSLLARSRCATQNKRVWLS